MDESVPSLPAPSTVPAPPPLAAPMLAPPHAPMAPSATQQVPPAPVVPPVAPPPAAPSQMSPPPPAAPPQTSGTEMRLQPAPAPKRTKGLLIGGVALATAASVAAGAFVITRDSSDDANVDDTIEVIADPETSSEAYSFAAATTNAQQAQSVGFDMSINTPEGPMTVSAVVDRATERMSLELDVSQLDVDDSGLAMGDSMIMILDDRNHVVYVGGEFYGAFFDIDAEWVSMETSEMTDDSGTFDEVFRNPLDMTAVFGGLDPVDLGPDAVNGESLHHYQVVLDAATLAGEAQSSDLLGDLAQMEGVDELVYDVWVSEDNQIRRIVFDVDDAGERLALDMWIDISAEAVDIALPDPSQVTSLDDLLAQWSTEFEDIEFDTTDDDGSNDGGAIDVIEE